MCHITPYLIHPHNIDMKGIHFMWHFFLFCHWIRIKYEYWKEIFCFGIGHPVCVCVCRCECMRIWWCLVGSLNEICWRHIYHFYSDLTKSNCCTNKSRCYNIFKQQQSIVDGVVFSDHELIQSHPAKRSSNWKWDKRHLLKIFLIRNPTLKF